MLESKKRALKKKCRFVILCKCTISQNESGFESLLSRTYKRDKMTKVKTNLQISVEMNADP